MEQSNFTLNGVDKNGHALKITCEGIDDKELAHSGGLDLIVKATKHMISSTNNPMDFPEKEGDYLISDKVIALYLNEIGNLIRNTSSEPEYLENISNIELVKSFIEHINENPEVAALVKKDNEK